MSSIGASTGINTNSVCSCGNHVNKEGNPNLLKTKQTPIQYDYQMDSSFVHLPRPPPSAFSGTNENFDMYPYMNDSAMNDSLLYNRGFMGAHWYMTKLLQVAEKNIDSYSDGLVEGQAKGSGNESSCCLCSSCIQRINNALLEHTEELDSETLSYTDFINEERNKQRRMQKALLINNEINADQSIIINEAKKSFIGQTQTDESNTLFESAIQSFQQKCQTLTNACEEHERKLDDLNELLKDQAEISEDLSLKQQELLLEFNSLELDAKIFEDVQRQLTLQCHAAEVERSHLSNVRLHTALFDIVVDERGLRYPLINNLRLSHRPKSDLQWNEINAAWSQASQLIMLVCNEIKFTSTNFGIVPLVSCAKIKEVDSTGKNIYHHLGVDTESSMGSKTTTQMIENIIIPLQAFCNLLHQMFLHIKSSKFDGFMIPFEMSAYTVDKYDLRLLKENDDVSWGDVLHCIACNLQYLAQLA
mmetsp:Transcript_15479/g.18868  ORF Transcript_15479/g.18868 Transcript_15479/m.18868 type:complete len:474 (+) Transcript_15479:112-1533(+)